MARLQRSHENIVRCYETFETSSKFFIVTELLCGDTLQTRIIDRFHEVPAAMSRNDEELENEKKNGMNLEYTPFEEKQIAFMFYQMLSALDFLHGLSIVHRDVKFLFLFECVRFIYWI